MFRFLVYPIALLLVSPNSLLPAQHSPEVVVIDGARNPELIPQWFIWEQALRTINRSRTLNPGEPSLDEQLIRRAVIQGNVIRIPRSELDHFRRPR
jgi:hypothetical protein